jgi:hypothetical protein
MEWIGALVRFLFQVLVELLFQATGKLLIWLVSFGHLRTPPLFQKFGEEGPLLGGRAKDGAPVAGSLVAMVIGCLFWIVCGGLLLRLSGA